MPETPAHSEPIRIPAIPGYLIETRDLVQKQYPLPWQRFQSAEFHESMHSAIQLDLVKSTIALSRESSSRVYELAFHAASRLELSCEVSIHQSRDSRTRNAAIFRTAEDAKLVLPGDLSEIDDSVLLGMIAHELGHLCLWQHDGGDLLVTSNLLHALNQLDSNRLIQHSWKRFAQFSELFCDRCAVYVVGESEPLVEGWAASEGQLNSVREHQSHLAPDLRKRALEEWTTAGATAEPGIDQMILGSFSSTNVDLRQRQTVSSLVESIIAMMLKPRWMRTEKTLAHAELFLESSGPPQHPPLTLEQIRGLGSGAEDLIKYVMLDFVTVDRHLMEAALGLALSLTGELGLQESFVEVARKELKLRKKQVEEIKETADKLAARLASQSGGATGGRS